MINKASLERLSPEHQKVLMEEAAAISARNSELQQGREQSLLEEIRKSGRVKVIEDPDRAAFQARIEAVYGRLAARWGAENLARLRAEITKLRGG
jgi:TRAP-type C4-dicarboxylate transport system substrate-binding protein